MLKALQRFFDRNVGTSADAEHSEDSRLRLATAVLFVEVTRADFEVEDVEDRMVLEAIESTLEISSEQAHELLELAKIEASEAVELFQFTRLVDRGFTAAQKIDVLQRLWEVAFSDSHLDHQEERLVRKVADLLHVPHSDFIAAKKRARHRF